MLELERFFETYYPVIIDKLSKELDKRYKYHDERHTIDVIEKTQLIGARESVEERDLVLLKIAALFHDTGFLYVRALHEKKSVEIFRESLQGFQMDAHDQEVVERCILATKMPQQPNSLLEMVICDADLDYLGRTDFHPISETLYEEMFSCNEIPGRHQWNELQIRFLSAHRFHTPSSIALRQPGLDQNIQLIQTLISKAV
jgi:predicted metal-dependent HD superfamily phosphohydrolase